jgi:hypothetical protein
VIKEELDITYLLSKRTINTVNRGYKQRVIIGLVEI